MLKLNPREMKFITAFLPFLLFSAVCAADLTAFNGNMGAINNNQWVTAMNPARGGGTSGATADFGNCNSLILRCATPKCAGCTSMDIALPIVRGCVEANPNCKQYGDALVQTLSAQMVGNATARANEQAAAAQAMAAQAAASQNNQQLEAMQGQMMQMQQQMAAQAQESAAAQAQALAAQREMLETAAAQAAAAAQSAAAQNAAAQTAAQMQAPAAEIANAATNGVSADVLAREKIGGQILTQLENAENALAGLKKTMQDVFDYAGCDQNGNNCSGPKRVRTFKQRANNFFEPYETVLDEVYDSLILAQSLGVNLTDIYMMLNNSCNVWGKYMCRPCGNNDFSTQNPDGTVDTCTNGFYEVAQRFDEVAKVWRVIPNQKNCTLVQMLTAQDEVQQNWLDMERGSSGGIRVACASDAIEGSALFSNRRKQSTISIETLQRIIEQDAPSRFERGKEGQPDITRFCSVNDDDVYKLQMLTQKKALTSTGPDWGKVCVSDKNLSVRSAYAAAATITSLGCNEPVPNYNEECQNMSGNALAECKAFLDSQRAARIKTCETGLKTNTENCTKTGGLWNPVTKGCDCESVGKFLNSIGGICMEKPNGVISSLNALSEQQEPGSIR